MCLYVKKKNATPIKADRDIFVRKFLMKNGPQWRTPYRLEPIRFKFGRVIQKAKLYSQVGDEIIRYSRGIHSTETVHNYEDLTSFVAKIPKGTKYVSSNLRCCFGRWTESTYNNYVSEKLIIYKSEKWYHFYKWIGL